MNKVIIIGGGCAGLTAGIYAARAELQPLIFTGEYDVKGGLLTKTSVVENYPGFPEGIQGYDLIENFETQAINSGARIESCEVTKIVQDDDRFEIIDIQGRVHQTLTIIIATGSKPNKLGLPDEDRLWAKGISSCAVCDGALYRNKKIVVVGGGDSALEEANFLTKFSDVLLIHRRDEFRGSKAMQNKVLQNPKIKILYNTVITELIGQDKLERIRIKTQDAESEILVDGLFYGLGLKPNNQLLRGLLDLDEDGYVKVSPGHYGTATNIPGIFVCGDVHDKVYRQAIVACGDGCRAAMDCNEYLSIK